jgi:hypothetical protein
MIWDNKAYRICQGESYPSCYRIRGHPNQWEEEFATVVGLGGGGGGGDNELAIVVICHSFTAPPLQSPEIKNRCKYLIYRDHS